MAYAAYLHPHIETMAPSELTALQVRKWSAQWNYVRTRSAFYQRKLAQWAGRAITLDELAELPLTDKDDGEFPRKVSML